MLQPPVDGVVLGGGRGAAPHTCLGDGGGAEAARRVHAPSDCAKGAPYGPCHVVALNLTANGLEGTLTAALAETLDQLQRLAARKASQLRAMADDLSHMERDGPLEELRQLPAHLLAETVKQTTLDPVGLADAETARLAEYERAAAMAAAGRRPESARVARPTSADATARRKATVAQSRWLNFADKRQDVASRMAPHVASRMAASVARATSAPRPTRKEPHRRRVGRSGTIS